MALKDRLNELTIEEKFLLLQPFDSWHLNEMPKLSIPSILLSDGPNGVNTEGKHATAIPTESSLSASWNLELVKKIGELMGEEAQAYGIGVLLGPGVNGKRSPLGGRNFEYYSEDPYLSGKLAAAFICGIQSQGVGCSLKHFVCNEQETRRFSMNAIMDERTFREIYLSAFEIAIKEGNPWTIMGSYPKLNGTYNCENKKTLVDILRNEFHYDGVVLSDWGACVNKVESHNNGLDLETGTYSSLKILKAGYEAGEITEKTIDIHAGRVLDLMEKIIDARRTVTVDWETHHEMAREAARESIVLLKNDNYILPLSKNKKIAVVGAFAKEPRINGGGSSSTQSRNIDKPLDFIQKYATVTYAAGYGTGQADIDLWQEAVKVSTGMDAVIVFVGTTQLMESEGADRMNMTLPEEQKMLIQEISAVNRNVIIVNSSGSPVALAEIEKNCMAILHTGLCGEGMGAAVADILFGACVPSGKLSETFPVCVEQTPAYPYFPEYGDDVFYREGIMVGYRYYDTKKIKPLYAFGHGLSYTVFEYSNLKLSKNNIKNGETLEVTCTITNVGRVAGKEIVQLYVSDDESYIVRPNKELKGFCKIYLKPGEKKKVTFHLTERDFAYFVPHLNRFAVEEGTFHIIIASASDHIELQESVFYESKDSVKLPLTNEDTLADYYEDQRYRWAVREVFEELHIDEEHPAFPMAMGMMLKNLSGFVTFFGKTVEDGERMKRKILSCEQ